jgi:hypothetical protein
MNDTDRSTAAYQFFALGGALLWGLVETIALARSRWISRRLRQR